MITATVSAHSATHASSGRSVRSRSAGLPPPSRWCTRYRYRKIPYKGNGMVKPSQAVPNFACVSGLMV